MANAINFTPEHRKELMDLAGEALISGAAFKGSVGSTINIYDLFHNCNINTLSSLHGNMKKEISKIEELDEWSLDDYQKRKAASLRKFQRLLFLLIGFKRKQAEDTNMKATAKELRARIATLKDELMTPEDRIKEAEAALAALGPVAAETE